MLRLDNDYIRSLEDNRQGDRHKSEVVLTLLERQWQEIKKTQVWYAGTVLAWTVADPFRRLFNQKKKVSV